MLNRSGTDRLMERFVHIREKLDYTFAGDDTRERRKDGNFNANSTKEKEWEAVAKNETGRLCS